ncbi:hypothetical protein AX774_g2962, partial [Zancudomyces culisetae]
MHTAIRTA